MLAGFTAFLSLYAVQPLLPLFEQVFDASAFAVSMTVTATTIAVALSAPLVGRLADVWGKRRVIVISAFVLGAAMALAATARTLHQVIVWRFVQGLVTPGVFSVAVAYIHDRWDPSRAGAATAAYVSGTVVGGFSGRAATGLVASAFGWRMSFLALGAMSLACSTLLALWLPGDRASEVTGPSRSPAGSLAAHLTNPRLLGAYGSGFCALLTQIAMFTYVTFHLAGPPFGLTSAGLGWLFAVYLVGAIITPASGRFIDEYGHRLALALAMTVGIVGSLLTLSSVLAVVIAGLAFVSTSVFIAQAAASSYVGVAAGQDRGLAVGLYSTFYYLGGSVGGALPAVFWKAGGWTASVVLVVVVQIATATIGWLSWTAAEIPGSNPPTDW